ncbi:MAG: DUF4157 domain-containing protein [Kofleriaceae bacterium]
MPGKRTLTMDLADASPAVVVQRKPAGGDAAGTGAVSTTSGGQAMPAEVRAKMEHAFGADFSAVRIHQGGEAQSMGALAYTQGSDIHFAPGQYDPTSARGQELLGHELTHVVQQSQGRVPVPTQAKGLQINDDAALEGEADQMGARAARGEALGMHAGGTVALFAGGAMQMSPGETIQRIVVALGVTLAVASAIYWAVPASVATILGTSGLLGLGEYWTGIVNGLLGKRGGSPGTKPPEGEPKSGEPKSGKPSGKASTDKLEKTPVKSPDESSKTTPQDGKPSKSLLEGDLGDCLYSAVNRARGNPGSNEGDYRRIATDWLVHQQPDHEVFQFGSQSDVIGVVAQQGAWTGDAGDLSAVALAYSLGIRLTVVTAGASYVFDGGGAAVTIYHHASHYTSFPVEGVHVGSGSVVIATPKKKAEPKAKAPEVGLDKPSVAHGSPSPSAHDTPGGSAAKRADEPLDPYHAQRLRNVLRILGAQSKLTEEDMQIRAICKAALDADRISVEDTHRVEAYLAPPTLSFHHGGPSAKPTEASVKPTEAVASYDKVVTLSNGTQVDYPALNKVMDGVVLGTAVAPDEWRAMRQALSEAITLENKSHPAHGSNFNKKQRPEEQIKDWATPIKGPLRDALEAYFRSKGVWL